MKSSEEIKQKLDIVDVIREYLPLKPAGMNFRAKCPFHREKTPSFMVSPDKQIWHCFGCQKGGDIFSFIQEIEGIDFVEALRMLAPKAGVTLRRQDPKLASQRNRMLDILEMSRKYFHHNLINSPTAAKAREYLKERSLSEETIEEWQIGYSSDSWDAAITLLKSKGFKENEILLSGMIVKSQNSSRFYDRFRARIMFPINDINGNTVAFSARVSPEKEAEEKMGKYINSPATQVYDKSKILFGLDKAKMNIKKEDLAIIVEGQMDAISAHQAGFKNVVASSGTALTADQIQILKRYTLNIAIAFDMDEAGAMAADRGIREAMRAEMNIKVIEVPQGKDPDDCIREDPAIWQEAVKSAKPMMQYYFDQTLKDKDLSQVENKRSVSQFLLPIIAQLGNRIEQDFWLKALAEALAVKEEILREAIQGQQAPKAPKAANEEVVDRPAKAKNRDEKMSELILALILKFPELLNYVINNIRLEHIQGSHSQGLYKSLINYYNIIRPNTEDVSGSLPILAYSNFKNWLISNDGPENTANTDQLRLLDQLVFLGDREYTDISSDLAKNELIKIVLFLKKVNLLKQMKNIERLIAKAEQESNSNELNSLMEELKILSEEMQEYGN
ncbi:DNA primase [Candidatus Parcubacteria bacterium]|nr:DNA primase [Candidatus Parcubacteria bacterium]